MSKSEGAFGPPIEAFHCGATAVVSKVTGYDEYILNNENSITVDIDDFDKARDTLIELQDSPDVLETLQFKAIKTAENWPSISESALLFANVCSAVVNSPYTLIDTHWAREQLDGAQYHYLRNPQYVNWALE
jgi:glycosyltransferase involved in cell wall biosynthesis